MPSIKPPDPKALPLLRLIVEAIEGGRFREGNPRTFLTYSEALGKLGRDFPSFHAGSRLQKMGLTALNDWTKRHPKLPKIAALIVNKKSRLPGTGFPKSHGYPPENVGRWRDWWLHEANQAIHYNWAPFLKSDTSAISAPVMDQPRVREDEEDFKTYRGIITLDPPPAHIRESRITVGDILRWMADGQSEADILDGHPELQKADIRASLAYAAELQRKTTPLRFTERWTGKFTLPEPDPDDPRLNYLLEKYQRNRR